MVTAGLDSANKTKIDNYGTITTDSTSGLTLYGYNDDDTIINNYSGGTISAPNGKEQSIQK